MKCINWIFFFSLAFFVGCLNFDATTNKAGNLEVTPTPAPTSTPTPTPTPTPIADTLSEIVGTAIASEIMTTGLTFTEGPVWHPDGFLLFSDVDTTTGGKLFKIDSTDTFSIYADLNIGSTKYFTNGLAVDSAKKIIMATPTANSGAGDFSLHAITKLDPAAPSITTLTNSIGGQALHSTNDLTLKSNGDVYFTDNTYGGTGPLTYKGIFRYSPTNTTTTLLDGTRFTGAKQPNGIVFSPDETKLYVSDTETDDITVYGVKSDGTIESPTTFATAVDQADGIKVSEQGHIFATTGSSGIPSTWGIKVFHPNGTYLGLIPTASQPANCAFGGTNKKTLYITARAKIYKISLLIKGR